MRKALIVIDVQNGFINANSSEVIPKIVALLETNSFDHVIATKFINTPDSPFFNIMDWQGLMTADAQSLVPEIEVYVSSVFEKQTYSCVNHEMLDFLKTNEISEVYLAGVDTECCVLSSAVGFFENNIHVHVLVNYCASTGGLTYHEAGIKVMERLVGKKCLSREIDIEKRQ